VIARRQLRDAGISRDAIHHRLGEGRLQPLHRGVYAVGHRRLSEEGRWMAAVLAAGPGAVLSHRAAATLWAIALFTALEVTVSAYRRRPGIRIHTSPLALDEVTAVRGIPVTEVSRTLFDLAAVVAPHRLERAANEAEIRDLGSTLSLAELIARYPHRRGIAALRAILARLESGITVTRSELEARFVSFVRDAGLPAPRANARVLGFERDCVWAAEGVIVELDGRAAHGTAAAFERDRARDRALAAAGWRTVRVTWNQLEREQDALARDLRKILWDARRDRARGAGP
jgi:very-short-patch-repair endonuclease